MKKIESNNKIFRFFDLLYVKLFKINDTPQKIALGFGLGVFCGILPGTGPLASLFLAVLFRVNRASALLGSLLTNTWLSIVTFILAIKLGSAILGISWQQVYRAWFSSLKVLHWLELFKLSILKLIFPVILGYFVVSFCLGVLAYLLTLIIMTKIRHENKS
jgi:hypothetical protein